MDVRDGSSSVSTVLSKIMTNHGVSLSFKTYLVRLSKPHALHSFATSTEFDILGRMKAHKQSRTSELRLPSRFQEPSNGF